MYSRWYSAAVVLLWLAAMSWLVVEKVVPSLLVGDPPSYQRILAAQHETPNVAWALRWNGENVGWAVSTTAPLPHDAELTEVRSLIHFDRLPIKELIPRSLQGMFQLDLIADRLAFEARSTVVFDALGHVSRFRSTVGLPDAAIVKIEGWVDGAELSVLLHYGDMTPTTEPLKLKVGNALLSDSLSPQSQLPQLREGQQWTVETYGPFNDPRSPTELLHARVEGLAPVEWEGGQARAFVVAYRSDPGSSLGGSGDVRGTTWVLPDGTVVRQQVNLFNSTMTFVRLPQSEADALVRRNEANLAKDQLLAPLGGADRKR